MNTMAGSVHSRALNPRALNTAWLEQVAHQAASLPGHDLYTAVAMTRLEGKQFERVNNVHSTFLEAFAAKGLTYYDPSTNKVLNPKVRRDVPPEMVAPIDITQVARARAVFAHNAAPSQGVTIEAMSALMLGIPVLAVEPRGVPIEGTSSRMAMVSRLSQPGRVLLAYDPNKVEQAAAETADIMVKYILGKEVAWLHEPLDTSLFSAEDWAMLQMREGYPLFQTHMCVYDNGHLRKVSELIYAEYPHFRPVYDTESDRPMWK